MTRINIVLFANNPNIEKAETSAPQNFLAGQVSLSGKFQASERSFLKKKGEGEEKVHIT